MKKIIGIILLLCVSLYAGFNVGDNLGSHKARKKLDLQNNQITNVSSMTLTGNIQLGDGTIITSTGTLGGGGDYTELLNSTHTWTGKNTYTNGITMSSYCYISDNVGNGTTNPVYPLYVSYNENIATSDQWRYPIKLETNDTAGSLWQGMGVGIKFHLSTVGINADMAEIISTSRSNGGEGQLLFRTGTNGTLATNVIINEAGSVGIGTTNPGASLDVNASSSNARAFQTRVGSNYGLVVSTNGKIGIGTASPSVHLHLKQTAPQFSVDSGIGQAGTIMFEENDVNIWNIQKNGVKNLMLYDYMSPAGVRVFIKSGVGDIGIATSTPDRKLDINGGCIVRSSMTVVTDFILYDIDYSTQAWKVKVQNGNIITEKAN